MVKDWRRPGKKYQETWPWVSEHPNPTTKTGSKMGGAQWDPIGFDNHSHMDVHKPLWEASVCLSLLGKNEDNIVVIDSL